MYNGTLGGAYRVRTGDLRIANATRYQLCQCPELHQSYYTLIVSKFQELCEIKSRLYLRILSASFVINGRIISLFFTTQKIPMPAQDSAKIVAANEIRPKVINVEFETDRREKQ